MPDWASVLPALVGDGIPIDGRASPKAVGGGDISDAWQVGGPDGPVFLKTGPADAADMFVAEAEGLSEIASTATVRVPVVYGTGVADPVAWLALEWLNFESVTPDTEAQLGRGLAAMHRVRGDSHGWHRDNTIGSTPQINTRTGDWATFYRDCRLGFQLETAARFGYTGELQDLGRRFMERVPIFFGGHDPQPSLLHGDLWGGNRAACEGAPVIFDPAVYYGDRETDLAMTRLFGGFSRQFYAAYEEAWALPPGHETRLGAYQLYHVLNHLNLFGQSYLGRATSLLQDALATLG